MDNNTAIIKDNATLATNSGTSYEDLAHHSLKEDPYYVTLITNMADQKEVIASEDIYSVNGLKLGLTV